MGTKECYSCHNHLPISEYGSNGKSSTGRHRLKPRCKSCNHVYETALFEQKLHRIFGSVYACECCGYNKCLAALEFHHVDPMTKERAIAVMKNYSEQKLRDEINKCVLVCANCHREIHEGVRSVPTK